MEVVIEGRVERLQARLGDVWIALHRACAHVDKPEAEKVEHEPVRIDDSPLCGLAVSDLFGTHLTERLRVCVEVGHLARRKKPLDVAVVHLTRLKVAVKFTCSMLPSG